MTDMKTDRRDVLAGLTAAAGLTLSGRALAKDNDLSFLVVGDWGRNGTEHQADVARQMDRAASETNSRFTVSVGDNFYDNGVQSVDDPLWKTSFEDIYTGPNLQTPWYVALGNHDYRGVPQAQLDYARTSPRWKMPSRYYKVSGQDHGFGAADVFVIDTSPLVHAYANKPGKIGENVKSQDSAAQLAWLDRELGASTARWKIVFGHHTLYSGGSGHGDTPEMIERVLPILQAHKVPVYINGHDHDLQHIRRSGIDIICSGAGSEVRPVKAVEGTKFCAAQSGFTTVTVSEDALTFAFRNYRGETLYRSSVSAPLNA
ncbi:hypothetical protein AEAC466_05960 [Asticcacaulis sp. AC466]|uniref:purple acid phosphatase family protein n=1 Tax=Asticcacaulis sp. AC466 TaxID=1282362 RepID=UPI0003C3C983|nr:tartrate-resistant acid phosphatase type 5 family protein [Asticcacaulis sp. AC466]ESQ85255.1 hypothetical protein AEAC466_05960 [Asticcacaulis sp. AC466]